MRDFLLNLITQWWGITIIVVLSVGLWFFLSVLLYRPLFKRFYDILLSGIALIVLLPMIFIEGNEVLSFVLRICYIYLVVL